MDELTKAFTANGKLKPPTAVTPAKVAAVKELVESTLAGDRMAKGKLEQVFTSSDAIHNYAYYLELNILPQFERAPRTWTQIATDRALPNFKKPVLYSLVSEWSGLGREGANPEGVAPIIPEGAPYPYAYMGGEEALAGGLNKRGFKTDWTWEAFINGDSDSVLAALPQEMLRVALDSEEYDVYNALLNGGRAAVSQLAAGTAIPTGGTSVANAPFSRDALLALIIQMSQRTINGRQVQINGGYNLIVPVGQALYVNFVLNQTLGSVNTNPAAGTPEYVYQVNGFNPFAGVTVIESTYVTGTQWFLIPKPGSTARPVLEHLSATFQPAPEVRIQNLTGNYVGGGQVSPFEGSFDTDTATLRMRLVSGSVLWTPALVGYSRGDNSAVS